MELLGKQVDQVSYYMGLIQIQKNVLNWMASTDKNSRISFAKIVLGMLKEGELRQCMSTISKARKKIKKTQSISQKNAARDALELKRSERGEPFRKLASVPLEISSDSSQVPSGPEREVTLSTSEPLESTAGVLLPTLQAQPKLKCWWHEYDKCEVVAIDCEHVHMNEGQGASRIKAGTVSISNVTGEIIFHSKIFRAPGTFDTNPKMRAITAIQDGVHSCKEDAKATMKLFLDVYPKTKSDKTHRSSEGDYDQFNAIQNIKKKLH
ncbi:unnamed protein product [Allacma fusca]|uniref:Exonuclease domain-containing protein n=1 Tax=Allacma fusca TaxID=39272 RepID=A0A8J2NLA1_9HEXA|nr:unnamed protein product [Allacma fusca]